ncbi:hypothetical protein OPV22_030355 [Ensete ventricosum]|uniref:CCT domain-containing protein n=1 Tax=Ensete ventricosum TaxID=4639 RepID=A0AAV8QBT9_ENSVE|nr:hypothetical protein OPV22_030355 [Ensete ventricosum]
MQQDVINTASEQLSVWFTFRLRGAPSAAFPSHDAQKKLLEEESISSPIAAQILDFCDGDVGGDLFSPPDIALLRFTDDVNAEASATTPLPCYADDASFSPFPSPLDSATLSALLDAPSAHLPDPEADVVLPAASSPLNTPLAMFPASPPYAGEHHLGPFDDQISMGDAATSGYRPYSPDPAAARGPPSCQQQRRTASDEEYYAAAAVTAMQQTLGFAGMEPAPPCGLLEGGGVGALYYRGGMVDEDGRDGFFYTGDMMAAAPGASFVGPPDVADYHRLDGVLGLYGQDKAPPQRAYSTGDLQVIRGGSQHLMAGGSGKPALLPASDIPIMDETAFKVGRLSVEERKEKIHRYMKKRNERNFSKKIKYACRKTLADSRPRVRGRFARNDEFGEITKPSSSNHEFDDDEEVVVKEEEDILDSSDILAHISGVNSFKYNFTLESWI